MPSVARIAALVLCGLAAAATVSACGSSPKQASGFCATIRRPDPAFNALDAAHEPAALAAFDRVAAQAPEPVATDLHTVSTFRGLLRSNPTEITKQPSLLTDYFAAVVRVDAYLRKTCDVRIPPFGKI